MEHTSKEKLFTQCVEFILECSTLTGNINLDFLYTLAENMKNNSSVLNHNNSRKPESWNYRRHVLMLRLAEGL